MLWLAILFIGRDFTQEPTQKKQPWQAWKAKKDWPDSQGDTDHDIDPEVRLGQIYERELGVWGHENAENDSNNFKR